MLMSLLTTWWNNILLFYVDDKINSFRKISMLIESHDVRFRRRLGLVKNKIAPYPNLGCVKMNFLPIMHQKYEVRVGMRGP